jgi:uncharacterized membrane protein YgaE (UPF0421/DUF939 family)
MATERVHEGEPAAKTTPANWAKLHYALKTALSLTLAYLIPMGLGWPQPQTAATTVMLIAATGLVSDSLQKGVMRVVGTVVGAIIGLTLIAIFPQDRMTYLLAVSCVVAFVIYLYNAYQGDSTVFMLTAVVTLMVFNGGDAEGSFLYGVDRAFMTAFGVIVYTLVASLLWPVKSADNTRSLASEMAGRYRAAFARLVSGKNQGNQPIDDFLSELLSSSETFQSQLSAVKNHADGVSDYLPEWNTLAAAYEDLQALLLPALKRPEQLLAYPNYINNYHAVVDELAELFHAVDLAWQGERSVRPCAPLQPMLDTQRLRDASHLDAAAVAARADLLQNLQRALLDVLSALDSMLFDQAPLAAGRAPKGKPAFIWFDLENVKTALRVFVTFWLATAIWIQFNPPGGFMFVTLCTIMVPLVSYTPATPKLLFILFTLGFLFALPAYIFLLPQMTHWLQLAVFIFSYAFIGFYVFQGPVSIFFLLGLFTLGIQNTMSYYIDAILLGILMFYMLCAVLIISVYFPFSSKPSTLYRSLRYRFFSLCARWLRLHHRSNPVSNFFAQAAIDSTSAILLKMVAWGQQVDMTLFNGDGRVQVAALNRACEMLHGQLEILQLRRHVLLDNPLVSAAVNRRRDNALAMLCDNLAHLGSPQDFENILPARESVEAQLDELLGDDYLQRYDVHQIAQFYVYLNLQASILDSIVACRDAQQTIDWHRLRESRF